MLHTRIWNPGWTVVSQSEPQVSPCHDEEAGVPTERERAAGPPPRRDNLRYAAGKEGDDTFREDRRQWFEQFTGVPLCGTVSEQNEKCDAIARRFRGYGDGRVTVWDRWEACS